MFKVVKNYEHIAFAYTFGKKFTLSLNALRTKKGKKYYYSNIGKIKNLISHFGCTDLTFADY